MTNASAADNYKGAFGKRIGYGRDLLAPHCLGDGDAIHARQADVDQRDVRALLQTIPRDVTIVMIEHNMDVALDFAERITLLHFGEVIVEGSRAEVVADPRTREVYLGH